MRRTYEKAVMGEVDGMYMDLLWDDMASEESREKGEGVRSVLGEGVRSGASLTRVKRERTTWATTLGCA